MKKNKPGIFLVLLILLFFGCASHLAANAGESGPKHITDIVFVKSSESLIFTIKTNQLLIYSANKRDFPMGVLLYFSDTSLDLGRSVYTPPQNEVISSIKAHEIVEDNTTSVRIFFALKKESPYSLANDDTGVKITFPRTTSISPAKPQKKLVAEKPPVKIVKKSPAAAKHFKKVTTTPQTNNIAIEVQADGAIKNFKSFTLDNPDRIILDLYNLKSFYKEQQIIKVESKWVKRIRHYGHPDKVRLVIETRNNYLSSYSALPTDTGLLIHVGKLSASSNQAYQPESDDSSETGQVKLAWDEVPDATSYNVYWSASPGVNRNNGNKIPNIKKPATTIRGLQPGMTYYFVVTTVKGTAESQESEELSFTVKK
jgi:hypothetical protein